MAPETPFSCNTVGCDLSSELYFARCFALNRSGTICNRKQRYEFILSDFKKLCLIFHIPDINQCVNNYFEPAEKS